MELESFLIAEAEAVVLEVHCFNILPPPPAFGSCRCRSHKFFSVPSKRGVRNIKRHLCSVAVNSFYLEHLPSPQHTLRFLSTFIFPFLVSSTAQMRTVPHHPFPYSCRFGLSRLIESSVLCGYVTPLGYSTYLDSLNESRCRIFLTPQKQEHVT
ncbi:hypothetical protein, unlikely [Trypanosoma brucei gambiense DAL972]|uniref:Uncharacterized protein n=1 Tax=Trypanosoma brucei gambiense (strain MHOM/CI/86/DAL972) TaxID=679716 RepID=C9ZQ08_TRYB9|nr:hypothetical protein, unlikely [Trypanosoma brucei gambiense DAL972]CBH11486.1 hypothetical protein, unlikely [Trypanosoma brucei gambiense DAL972]|eukprot:XP_011773773.1 hypothetical protein, unlikely [Trypanosoma brucei gambiense DAL972]